MGYDRRKVIDVAIAELGYREKETNSQLYDKTANAGDDNFTKFAKELYEAGYYNGNKNGFAWCDVFVDWCFYKAFGKTIGQMLQCQTGDLGAGCKYSANYYRNKGQFHTSNPQPGDQIFFGKAGAEEHTGIVEKVEGGKVHTIEGNSSNRVQRLSYALTHSRIVGYGRPAYDDGKATETKPIVTAKTGKASTSADVKDIIAYLKTKGFNVFGVYGILANLFNESGFKSNNLQNTGNNRLGMTDEAYTKAVDDGSYTKFVNDSLGYGLCQWTYHTRKKALLEYANAKGKTIADWKMQLDFMCKELTGYSKLLQILKTATSVKEASDAFMCQFERPADQSEAAKARRAKTGEEYYNKYEAKTATSPEPEQELKVGDKVKMEKGATVYGTVKYYQSWVYDTVLYVREVKGSRVVVSTVKTGPVTGAVNKKHLKKV